MSNPIVPKRVGLPQIIIGWSVAAVFVALLLFASSREWTEYTTGSITMDGTLAILGALLAISGHIRAGFARLTEVGK
jgi:hydrogenase-4 membrane subunit HyfE